MRIQICSNQGAGPLGGHLRDKKRGNFDKSLKIFFSWTTDLNALIFGIGHP